MDPSPTSIEPPQQQHQLQQPNTKKSEDVQSEDYVPYPKLDPKDTTAASPPSPTRIEIGSPPSDPTPPAAATVTSSQKSVRWSPELTTEAPPPPSATNMPRDSNPYVSPSPAQSSSSKNTMETARGVLGRWGKKVGEATKKAEDLAGNFWQHLKTGPSVADAAMGRIAQGSKVLAEGGYEKIFKQTFETLPEENLRKSYACYLSTSAGPVMGVLYLSTAKLAFCSDSPLSYNVGDQTEWSYYKTQVYIF
ncbi:hypothetical protein ACLOJK_016418 [Asimina triloba]